MKLFTLSLAGLLSATALAGPAMAQQSPPSQPRAEQPGGPQTRQRAPGVPMAPRADIAKLREQGSDRDERMPADRSPPMPRGVPSIIAP